MTRRFEVIRQLLGESLVEGSVLHVDGDALDLLVCDPLATEIFDFQAKALGLHVANLAMALDPKFVVIGGGLMDPEATTTAFRENYLNILRATAREYLWPYQREALTIVPAALGDLS